MILASIRSAVSPDNVAPAAGLFGYCPDDLARLRCPYTADAQKFAELFVDTCSCALHRVLRAAAPSGH